MNYDVVFMPVEVEADSASEAIEKAAALIYQDPEGYVQRGSWEEGHDTIVETDDKESA